MNDIHTTLPGEIVSWNGSTAVVKPAMPKKLTNGKPLAAPQIVSVPVCFPVGMGGKALISVPLQAGDPVTLHFSERSLENWLSGSNEAPDDPRQYDLSDCFAAPVVRPMVGSCDTENLSMSFGAGSIKISASGEVAIDTPKFTVNGETAINGNTSITGSRLLHNGKNVGDNHKHDKVVAGGAISGEPI